jgi:hypothetical protein
VTAVEGAILVASYFGYILLMVYNKQVNEWAERKFGAANGGAVSNSSAISQIAQVWW